MMGIDLSSLAGHNLSPHIHRIWFLQKRRRLDLLSNTVIDAVLQSRTYGFKDANGVCVLAHRLCSRKQEAPTHQYLISR